MSEQKKTPGRPQIYQGWQEVTERGARIPRRRADVQGTKADIQSVKADKPEQKAKPLDFNLNDQSQQTEDRVQTQQVFSPRHIPESEENAVARRRIQPQTEKKTDNKEQPSKATEKATGKTITVPIQMGQRRAASIMNPVPDRRGAAENHGNTPAPGAGRTARRSENGVVQAQGKRHREQENEAKMRVLWGVLGVLAVLLVVAIIYEIILGHGIKETGAERMAAQDQETIVEILNGVGQTESDGKSEPMSENVQVESGDIGVGAQTERQSESQSETDSVSGKEAN